MDFPEKEKTADKKTEDKTDEMVSSKIKKSCNYLSNRIIKKYQERESNPHNLMVTRF